MEDTKLFYEDRKGRCHSEEKFINSEQTGNSTSFKRRKTFNQDSSYLNQDSSNFYKYRNSSYSTEDHKNINCADNYKSPQNRKNKRYSYKEPYSSQNRENKRYSNEPYSSQNHGNRRYSNKESYSSRNNHDDAIQLNKDRNTGGIDNQEKDKKLSELISFYEKILQTLKEGLSNEDTEPLVYNVLAESKGYEVRLSSNRFSSHCIELLLSFCKDPTISRQFMTAFALEKEEVCTNANASHVTELLLNIAVQNIQNWSSVLESDESNPDKENVSYFMSWIEDLGEFIIEHFDSCLQNQYACHVFCSEIRALGGDMSSVTDFMSKKSANHKREFHHQYAGEDSSKTEQHLVPVILEYIPKSFTKFLKKVLKAFLKTEGIIDYVTESSSATVIQTLLCILKKRSPKHCKKLISGLATRIFSEKNDNNVPKAFLHRNCSFMVEKMFASADEELHFSLWNDYIADSLEYLVTHSVGNYIIQRLFDVVESKEQFELMNEKIGSIFEIIRSSGHYGIFISIAGACNRLKVQQAQFMKNIMQCHQCAEPEDKQIQLVPRLLGFKVCDEPNISICLQGSLLVQAILKFQKPIKVVNSILNMKPPDIAFLACHMQGCHIFNAFFSSNSVGEKSKDKLIQSLKPCIIGIASDRNGSLTLSRIWMLLSIKQRSILSNILVQAEKILNANRNGSVLLKKCGIFYFKKNIEKWREIQKNLSHTNTKDL